ncbi:hypothetical protein CBS101457_001400 [Exobasidium rhododendri]|nr:hypothetical protein CBS101457_001400 [Exobasidium rhododendri]
MQRAPASASNPSLPVLSKASLPTEQLTQIQRRLAHLLNSLAELQGHVSTAQTLEEWPSLLSRHLALASQTNSLTSFLALSNPNVYNAQVSSFNEGLTTDAIQNNKFALADTQDSGATASSSAAAAATTTTDVLFSGNKKMDGQDEGESGYKFVKVQYTDEMNGLRRLAPHPFFPLEGEKGQLMLPSLLLPKPEEQVVVQEEKRWKTWTDHHQGERSKEKKAVSSSSAQPESGIGEDGKHWLELVRKQMKEHDTFAGQAIRSFVHAREATDELGQRYDWKMRMDPDELSEEEETNDDDNDDDDVGVEGEANAENGKKRKRAEAQHGAENENSTLTIEQVGAFLRTGEL